MKYWMMGLLVCLCHVAQADPKDIIQDSLEQLFNDITALDTSDDHDYQNLIATHVSPLIDSLSMGQLILGKHWKRASIKQKQDFLQCFSRQFRATQAEALSSWQPNRWQILEQTFNDNQTKAAIKIKLSKSGESREFILRLQQLDQQWRIYDASYLGISLLKNFKDDYAVKINNQGLNKTLAQVCQQYPEVIKQLTIAGTQWPPFIARSLPGQGLSVEMVSAVLSRAGYQVKMIFAPWKRVMEGMKQGEFDISVAAWKNKQREQFLSFSEPYFYNQLVAIQSSTGKLNTSDLTRLLDQRASMGLMDDYAYAPVIQQYPNRKYYTQYGSLFRDIATKNLDFALLDRYVAQYYLRHFATLKGGLQVSTNPLDSRSLHITMIKQHPAAQEVLTDFNRYLKIYLKSRDYRALLTKYQIDNQAKNVN
ncbi:MAG: ABC transporter substrate-binding protein [Gammaproteobacteria bacterium]|nr:ABC transporter substrate-binding protein [Gammaproteobacteria bacterium]